MRRWITYTLIALTALQMGARPAAVAQEEEDLESNLKAAFLYNFTKYIEWQMGPDDSDFVIGIVGVTHVERVLQEIARTSRVDGRKIVIRHIEGLDQLAGCRLLFVAKKRHAPLREILSRTAKGEIVVAAEEGAAREGAGFNFILNGDKLRFEANTRALASSGLKVSSQLLKLAIIVN